MLAQLLDVVLELLLINAKLANLRLLVFEFLRLLIQLFLLLADDRVLAS